MSAPLRWPLPWCEPEALLGQLLPSLQRPGLVWLDGDGSALGGRSLLALEPLAERVCRSLPGEAGAEDPFAALAELEASGRPWLGWLAYEAGAWLEPGLHWQRPEMAVLWAIQADPLLVIDHRQRQLWLEGHDPGRLEALARRVERAARDAGSGAVGAAGNATLPAATSPTLPLEGWRWHTPRAGFAAGVAALRERIASGDLFQANLTACCEQELAEPADAAALLALYGRLRRHCPAPFAGLAIGGAAAPGEAVLSASPERFLQLNARGEVETRPIKGTRPRHADAKADADAAAELVTSVKDRAENVMIVDLLRNDLGRVCQPGSVQVPQLVGLESYRQVHHLTSVVRGRLRAGLGAADLLRACWPGGSITGAPKIRACQRLGELEPVPRGPYCGSLFRLDGAGGFDSNILIRSLFVAGRRLRAHAGCGIVADSDPRAEAEELDWKLQPLLAGLAGEGPEVSQAEGAPQA
jgi:para-aminobenzoate synthetase component 1